MGSFIPNFDSSKPHHSHFVAILSGIVIIVFCFLGYVIYLYIGTSNSIQTMATQPLPLTMQRVTLTPDQTLQKQAILAQTDTSQVHLTPEQSKAKTLQISKAEGNQK